MTEASTTENINVTEPLLGSVQKFVENGHSLWIACQVVTVVCSLFDIYFIICLSLHWRREWRSPVKSYFSKSARAKNDSQWGSTASRIANSRRNTGADTFAQNLPARRPKTRENVYRKWMLLLGLGASTSALVKCLVDQVKFFYAWDSRSDDACEVINDVTEVGLYGSTMVCVYAFLWVRQWMFYHNPAVKNLIYRKHLIRFSRFLPAVILTLLLVLSVFHLIPIKYKADTSLGTQYLGCVAVYDIANTHEALPIFFYIALTSTFQLSLLGLFLYPLVRRKIDAYRLGQVTCPSPSLSLHSRKASALRASIPDMTRGSCDNFLAPPTQNLQKPASSPTAVNSTADCSPSRLSTKKIGAPYRWLKTRLSNTEKIDRKQTDVIPSPSDRQNLRLKTSACTISKGMERSVIRASIWTTMCILTDVTMVTVALLYGPGTPLLFISTMNNFNIVVNQLCLIATYSRWKEILLPLCTRSKVGTSAPKRMERSSIAPPTSDASPGSRRNEKQIESWSRHGTSPSRFTFDENFESVGENPVSHSMTSEPGSPAFTERNSFHTKRGSL